MNAAMPESNEEAASLIPSVDRDFPKPFGSTPSSLARASPRCTSGSFSLCLAALSAMILLFWKYETAMLSSPRTSRWYTQQQQHYRCLQSDKEIDDLIGQASQIMIAMPAKAAGTSMKSFTKKCTGRDIPNNFLNREDDLEEALMMGNPMTIPKIITSHMYKDEPLVRLITHLPKSVLLIYVHREENERLMSGIKQAFNNKQPLMDKICSISFDSENRKCVVGEKELVETIKEKPAEIGFGEVEILTGKTFDAIEKNAPNMMFVHYKQVDKLQRVLAKHHCPEMLNEDTLRLNDASTKNSVETKVRFDTNEEVDLREWLAAKADLLQYALGMRKADESSQSLTRRMEEELFGCKTEFVHI